MEQAQPSFLDSVRDRLQKIDSHDYRLTRWLFLRTLGIIYLIAFASLSVQIIGLVGSNGILPIADAVANARTQIPLAEGLSRFPTLVWFNSSDVFLQGMCIAGIILALLLIANVLPKLTLIGLWGLYLSLV